MDPVYAIEEVTIAHQHAIQKAAASGDTPVQKFYEGSAIFVTGGTGFLGKLLIEKLLRTCTPSKIFVLIRQKRDKSPKERLIQVLKDPLFDELRKQKTDFEKKVIAIKGDISENYLGLNICEWENLAKEISVIFHVAANVRFDVDLKAALLSNTRGTREALRLASDCTQLRSFVYVSTAYAHATRDRAKGTVSENFYKTPLPPDAAIKLAESMTNEKLNALAPVLLDNWPNTYTFSKAIAEELIRTEGTNLPVCIIRPSIVTCTYRDPVPGWVDMSCAFGTSGVVLGLGIAVMHVSLMDTSVDVGLVPADIVNNSVIVAAWETASQFQNNQIPKIYTVTNTRNKLSLQTVKDNLNDINKKVATSKAIWYCFAISTKYKWLYNLLSIFLHYIPAYFVDGVCLLFGKPQMLVKAYKKVDKMMYAVSYFLLNPWSFEDDNLQSMFNNLSSIDKQIFNMDIKTINWQEKNMIWCLGVRKYLIKDDPKLSEYALKKQEVFKFLHYIVSVLYIYMMWKLVRLTLNLFLTVFQLVY